MLVREALAELDVDARTALQLIYRQHRTQAQVANELHLSSAAVRAAVVRGMRHVAERCVAGPESLSGEVSS